MFRNLLLFVFLLVCVHLSPLPGQPDSIQYYTSVLHHKQGNSKIKADAALWLAKKYVNANIDTSLHYCGECIKYAQAGRCIYNQSWCHYYRGFNLINKGDLPNAHEALLSSLYFFQQNKDLRGQLDANAQIGLIHSYYGNFDDALNYLLLASDYANQLKDPVSQASAFQKLGHFYSDTKNSRLATKYYEDALRYVRQTDKKIGEAVIGRELADVYTAVGQLKKAEDLLNKSITIGRENGILMVVAQSLASMATTKKEAKELYKARVLCLEALSIADTLGRPEVADEVKSILASIYLEMDSLTHVIDITSQLTSQDASLSNAVSSNKYSLLQLKAKALSRLGRHKESNEVLFDLATLRDSLITTEEHDRNQAKRESYLLEEQRKKLEDEKNASQAFFKRAIQLILLFCAGLLIFLFSRINLLKKLKRNAAVIQSQKDDLGRLNTIKDHLFLLISHDLRSPIRTTEQLLADIALEQTENPLLSSLQRQISSTTQLIDNLLIWSKAQLGGITPAPSDNDISEILTNIISLYKAEINYKNIHLITDIPSNIICCTDVNLLQGVLRNLISNAVKHTQPERSVFIQLSASESAVLVRIKNESSPLPLVIREMFKTNSYTHYTPQPGQEGFGLVICILLAKMNRVRLTLEDDGYSSNTTFILEIPL